MSLFRIYLRVLGLLAPEKGLATLLALANLALAGVYFLEPWLFGRVVDALAGAKSAEAWRLILTWAVVGFGGVIASVWVSLYADRLAHRRRQAAIAQFFEHAIALPLAFHGEHHTGRLLRIMHNGSSNLFGLWLGFFREHLATLLSILVMVPLALSINWKLALLMVGLMVSFATFNAIAMRRTHSKQGEVEELHHEISERAGDVLGNVLVVQSFTRHADEVVAIRDMMRRALAAQYPVLRGWAVLSVFNRAASTLTIVAIFADIRDVSLESVRRHIAVVFQDPGLFYRSIADNLRIGDPDATHDELERAARLAEAHSFIVVKPEGYSTLVAERGRSLSGGERQRLAIARAMLKDAPILILDEATSALDNATEARIQRALNALTKDRTTFRDRASAFDRAQRRHDPRAEGRRARRAGPLQRARATGRIVCRARCARPLRARRGRERRRDADAGTGLNVRSSGIL